MLLWVGIIVIAATLGIVIQAVRKDMRVPEVAVTSVPNTPEVSTRLRDLFGKVLRKVTKKVRFPTSVVSIALAIVGFVIFAGIATFIIWIVSTISKGVTSATKSVVQVTSDLPWWVPESHWYFVIILALSAIGILVWKRWKKKEERGWWPKKEVLTVLLGLPAVHWLTWAIFPEFWVKWLTSGYFFPMHIAVAITAWLAGKKSGGTLYKVTWSLITVLLVMTLWKTTGTAQGFDFKSLKFWGNSSAQAMPVPLTSSTRGKLLSEPWIFYQGPQRDAVIAAFPEDTVMWNIAACESEFNQWNSDGTVLTNKTSSAKGIFQIMESLHAAEARNLGMDILTEEGNIAFAKHLKEKNGYRDWEEASRACWKDGYPAGTSTQNSQQNEENLSAGSVIQENAPSSILPDMDPRRIRADSLITIPGDGEWTNKFKPGPYAIMWDVVEPNHKVFIQVHEIGAPSEKVLEMIQVARKEFTIGVQIDWIRFRAVEPSNDTVTVAIRWYYK